MGPSTSVDGEGCRSRGQSHGLTRFNGAVDKRRRRAESSAASNRIRALAGLQWGRRQASTESFRIASWVGSPLLLQWGRRQASTERPTIRPARPGVKYASMGPSTSVDGEARGGVAPAAGVEASMGPSTSVDGEPGRRDVAAECGRASMGPSTSVDGEATSPCRRTCSRTCFNGAVDKRRRRDPTRPRSSLEISVLQWGRRQASTESGDRAGVLVPQAPASMGPSTSVDGEVSDQLAIAGRSRRFNGAVDKRRRRGWIHNITRCWTSTLQWGRRQASTERPPCSWSPPASRCFNGAVDKRRRREFASIASRHGSRPLQWGRRQASTERGRCRP